MMKNKFKFLLIISVLMVFSCQEDDSDEDIFKGYSGNQLVFSDFREQVNVLENAGTLEVPVQVFNNSDSDITFQVTVTDDTAIEGTNYQVSMSSFTIPAGQYGSTLVIDIIDDTSFNESRFFDVEISQVSGSYQIGTGVLGSYKKRVQIVNEDCPANISIWSGALTWDDVGYLTGAAGTGSGTGTCSEVLVDADLPNSGGTPANTLYVVSLTPDSDGATTGTAEVARTLHRENVNFGSSGILDVFYESTAGIYDESTGVIIMNYRVIAVNDSGGVVGTWYTGQTRIYGNP